jgi:hypothetical protein
MDKLLISLHSSFAAVRTNLSLCTPEPSIKEITAALQLFAYQTANMFWRNLPKFAWPDSIP